MLCNGKLFELRIVEIPKRVEIMVVLGEWGLVNPLIGDVNDGVVGVSETQLKPQHCRLRVGATHNVLLYDPMVHRGITDFPAGNEVM